jgi:ATP-binding cassette subfamily B (MDR/TAP) protein 1
LLENRSLASNLVCRDLNKLQEGIGEKIGMMFFFVGTFLLSLIVAFVHGWELTLVLLCIMPLMAISGQDPRDTVS